MDMNRSGAARILRPTPKQRVQNDARQCLMNDPSPYLIVAARLFTAVSSTLWTIEVGNEPRLELYRSGLHDENSAQATWR